MWFQWKKKKSPVHFVLRQYSVTTGVLPRLGGTWDSEFNYPSKKENPLNQLFGTYKALNVMFNVRQAGYIMWDFLGQCQSVPEENIFMISCRITLRLNHMHDQGWLPCSVCEYICVWPCLQFPWCNVLYQGSEAACKSAHMLSEYIDF